VAKTSKTTKVVRAAEAKAQLSELVSRVAYGGERFLIERHGKPVAALVSAEDLAKLENGAAKEEPKKGLLALVGIWGDLMTDDEIDAMTEHIEASRSKPRPFEWPED